MTTIRIEKLSLPLDRGGAGCHQARSAIQREAELAQIRTPLKNFEGRYRHRSNCAVTG